MTTKPAARAAPAHTPTPWRTFDTAYGAVHIVKRASDSHLADIFNVNTERNPNAAADAAFIVRACNSHAALVAALRDLIDAGQMTTDALLEQGLLASPILALALKDARAALAAVDRSEA